MSSIVTIADNTKKNGASDTNVNFYGNRNGTNNWHDELTLQDFLPADSFLDYYNSTVTGWLFRFEMDGAETYNGYEHFWIGSSAPPTEFISTDGSGAAVSDSYTGHKWTGTYRFGATMKDLKVPLNGAGGGEGSVQAYKTKGTLTQVNGNYYAAFSKNETAHLYFGSCGEDEDVWNIQSLTGYALVTDAREPQLLGVAPMAGGSYLPGESVTVALVFDEIVDSENSTLENVSVVTSWGAFPYAGGEGTNVLYFTGTVSDTASGSLTVTFITGNEYIRDMAADEGNLTSSAVDVDTSAALGSANAPTVTVGQIANANGTLTATVACSPVGAKLEYVWSTSQTAPAAGWRTVASGASVSTRQTSGTWYLHARATNSDGVTVYGSQSVELGAEGTVQLPGLTVTANNDAWATSRTIAIDKSPSTAALTVKTPRSATSIPVEGNSYVATENGVYTFTLQSGDESVIKTVTVSKIDRTAPTIEIADLTNTTHTEAVILTVRVSDGQSGVASVKGKWNDEAEFDLTPTGEAGVYTVTSPAQSGTWTLTVTATDIAGNTGTDRSLAYRINATLPELTVTKRSELPTGVIYDYSVAANGNTGITVTLPDGTITTQTSGSFTIAEPGSYTIAVRDDAGHFVSKAITVDAPQSGVLDGVKPDVRLSIADESWTKGPVTVAVEVYDAGSVGKTLTAMRNGSDIQLVESAVDPGSFSGSFTVDANGTYTVTCTDASGNMGSGTIEITNIDTVGPVISVSGNPAEWTANDVTITLTVTDQGSGVSLVEAEKDGNPVLVSESNGTYTFTAAANGIYKVTAVDGTGNKAQQTIEVDKIDKSVPDLAVTGGGQSAASLNLTVSASAGESGVAVTVAKDGGPAESVSGGTYPVTAAGTYVFTATTGAHQSRDVTVVVHSVRFVNESAPYETHFVVSGGKVTGPAEPDRDGYEFAGWYDGDTMWNFGAGTVAGDLTLTAGWELVAPAVTLSADRVQATYSGGQTVITLTAVPGHGASVSYAYEWYKDDGAVPVASGTTPTLSLTDVAQSGKYTVKVTASAGGQSTASDSNAVTVTINRADPVVFTWPTASGITYGDSLGQSTLSQGSADIPGDFIWKDSSITPDSGAPSYAVVFRPGDMDNYNTAEQTVAITVAKRELRPFVVSAESKTYDGNPSAKGTIGLDGAVLGQTPTASGVFTFDNANAGPDKTVTVRITLDSGWDDNYELSVGELTATASITPKTVGLTWHGYENLVYTGRPVDVTATATGLVGDDACTVTVTDGDKVDVGTYTAVATGLSNPNYELPATDTEREYTIAMAAGTASVSMADWVYGETASTPVPVSATHGVGSVTYRYTGRNGTTYDSADVPTDVGSYTVTATFAAVDNYVETTASADFTVAPRPVFATWSALTHVYDGTPKAAGVSLSGVLNNDQCTLSITGYQHKQTSAPAPTDAAEYTAIAALAGPDAYRYTLQNGTAAMTIQPKPVIFTVAESVMQLDGSEKEAAVAADDENCTYQVIYRQDGKEVTAPKQAGSYEIWVEIADANYRHTNGGDLMQVGTLTITQAPPVVYTVSFAGGTGAEGAAPDGQAAPADAQIILPANPFTKPGGRFTGWQADGDDRLYQPGDSFIVPAQDVTFTAQWQAVFEVSGVIAEQTDGGTPVPTENAVVSLWLGANKISEATTGAGGTYGFVDLVPGIYNLVVTKDVRTVTKKVEIAAQDQTCDATLPQGATNSVVKVTPGSPDIVVGQLDTVFEKTDQTVYTPDDQSTVDAGGKVEITFSAEEKQKGDQTIAEDMDKIAAEKDDAVTLGLVMDYRLEKTVTAANGTSGQPTPITQANVLLEILLPLPAGLQGKDGYTVYRVHEGMTQELTMTPSADLGEYFAVNSNKTGLVLHVRCFSTYAIGYTESAEDNSGNDIGHHIGGSSGGVAPAYPPQVEQPEHGSVITSPQNPQKGDKVTITPAPDEGYVVDKVTVTDNKGQTVDVIRNNDGTYTFTQPSGKATITVTFRALGEVSGCPRDQSCPLAAFGDTDRNAWYHDGVHYCLEQGLMIGTDETAFEPDSAASRGMIVTILWRLEGSPITEHVIRYTDVRPGDWYGEAVRWADSRGIVTGYEDGRFGPDDCITREQMAAMLWRYAGSPEADGDLTAFRDGGQTDGWAQPAMIWAVEQGLIIGTDNNRLDPQGLATRAEAATILMRFAQAMER